MKNLIVTIILLVTTILNASIIVYEPFDYAPTNGITGLNGGVGWADAWYTSDDDSNTVITVPGLVCSNGVTLFSKGNKAYLQVTGNPPQRDFAVSMNSDEGTTNWFSFLVSIINKFSETDKQHGRQFSISFENEKGRNTVKLTYNVDMLRWAFNVEENKINYHFNHPYVSKETIFVIVRKINGTAQDEWTGWINPIVNQHPSIAVAGFGGAYPHTAINGLQLLTSSSQNKKDFCGCFDEFRAGEIWENVNTVSATNSNITTSSPDSPETTGNSSDHKSTIRGNIDWLSYRRSIREAMINNISIKPTYKDKNVSVYDLALNKKNKTVAVNILSNVKLRGRVARSDGVIITNFHFHATPYGLYEMWWNPGHIDKEITTDKAGNFEIDDLLFEHYKFQLTASGAQSITTNVVLYSDVNNYIKIVFHRLMYQNVIGFITYEKTDEPAAGIELKYKIYKGQELRAVTDKDGKFILRVPVLKNSCANLKVNESGYAKINYRLQDYTGEILKFFLRETGILTGKITNEKGEPVSGMRVQLWAKKDEFKKPEGHDFTYDELTAYSAQNEKLSDIDGIYVISNAAAPQLYKVYAPYSEEYFFPRSREIIVEIEPGKTTTCNFSLLRKPVVMVKLIDEKGKPVLKYILRARILKKNGCWSMRINKIDLPNGNEWHKVNTFGFDSKMKLSLEAEAEYGITAEEIGMPIVAGKEYKIILKLTNSVMPVVAGFVYKPDSMPYVGGSMHIYTNNGQQIKRIWNKHNYGICDHLGYFEICGVNIKKGKKIRLTTNLENVFYTTNVFAGEDNIEWVLPEPKRICGRVCIGNINTPATNFAVRIKDMCNNIGFCSETGHFSLPIGDYKVGENNRTKICVFIQGYAMEIRDVDFSNSKTCDVGNIIVTQQVSLLKSGEMEKIKF